MDEASWLEARGADVVIAQWQRSRGHRGMFLSDDVSTQIGTMALVPQVVRAVTVPVIAAGGIADAAGVRAAMALGAAGVQIGTAYLLCPEASTSPLHRAALAGARARTTAVTNVFTGRPARGIVNRIVREIGPMSADAPAFPMAAAAVAALRAHAERAGRDDFTPLWAGQNASGCREVPATALTRTWPRHSRPEPGATAPYNPPMRRAVSIVVIVLGLAVCVAAAQDDTRITPGEFVVEHPTLINLGFEWHVSGDANRNATVEVSFRKAGEASWRQGMPLLRLHGEQVFWRNIFDLTVPNMFAGSILDLEPGTAYEARFVLSDPDGVAGTGRWRDEDRDRPDAAGADAGGGRHGVSTYPVKWRGPKEEPAFESIMCAYNYYCGAGDTAPGGRPRVKPGDTILVHAGTYAYHYEFYANNTTINATTTFEGTAYLTADGTPERPIAIKAAGDGEVVLDGRGNFALFNVKAADYTYFEGITFRNTSIAIWAGTQAIAGAKGLTVKRCRFEDVGMGVFTNYSGSSDFYIADSSFIGRNDPKHLVGWIGEFWQQFENVEGQAFPPVMKSYTAIRLYGPGHVVAHNYVAHFHDGIDTEMYGHPDGSHPIEGPSYPPREFWDRRPNAIDIYGNYITNAHDNSIEMDGSMHNVRVMRNLLINSHRTP
ncbi:MAG: DUF561 domain-containing protein [Vicinamibacterales bacterium]